MLCIKIFYRIFSLHFDSNLSHIRSLSFDEWLYVSTLLIYVQDEWPQTWNGNPKILLDSWLGSRRVEDAKGVNLNTILTKLKCENTQHNMDCIQLAHPTQLCYFQFSLLVPVSLTWYTPVLQIHLNSIAMSAFRLRRKTAQIVCIYIKYTLRALCKYYSE